MISQTLFENNEPDHRPKRIFIQSYQAAVTIVCCLRRGQRRDHLFGIVHRRCLDMAVTADTQHCFEQASSLFTPAGQAMPQHQPAGFRSDHGKRSPAAVQLSSQRDQQHCPKKPEPRQHPENTAHPATKTQLPGCPVTIFQPAHHRRCKVIAKPGAAPNRLSISAANSAMSSAGQSRIHP